MELLTDGQRFDGEFELLGLTQQVNQHKGAGFAVVGLVHTFKTGQRAVGDAHVVAHLEQTGHGGGRGLAQEVDEFWGHLGGHVAKADQFAHAQGGANGRPVVVDVVEADEKVAAEHGLAHAGDLLAADFFDLHHRQEALKALVGQVLQGTGFLAGLGVDGVPRGGGRVCVGHVFECYFSTFEESLTAGRTQLASRSLIQKQPA